MTARIDAQLAFLNEADKLKTVIRATTLCDGSRHENSGEHSWHIALYALVLAEHAPRGVNINRVIQMLLLHDLVEIDAGDAPIFGDHDIAAIQADEAIAATRIFGFLPADQNRTLRSLWEEFEAAETPDAIFAKSLDRFQPPNQNLMFNGGSWADYGVDFDTIESRVGSKIERGAPVLWHWLAPKIKAWFAKR